MASNTEDKALWEEDRLVSLLKGGHEKAYHVLIQRYETKLFSVAYGITLDREEALDILQEVFLKVFEKIHTFRGEAGLSTWLHRITINQCLNWRRRWKRRFRWQHRPIEKGEMGDCKELGPGGDNPEALFQKKELKNLFRQRLKDLPEQAKLVFVLREVEGLSYEEIARVLKIKRGTVSSRLFYARKSLAEAIRKYQGGEIDHE